MQDEERAERLAAALAGEEALPEEQDDPELVALAALGADLARRGPELALLSQADEAFDPAFATRLRGTLLAAHPEAPADAGASAQGTRPAARAPRRRRVFRVLVALAVLAVAATAILLTSVVQNLQVGFQTGRAAPTATSSSGQPSALAPTGARLQSAGPGATNAAAGVVPQPVESAPLATPPPQGTAAVAAPPRPQTFAPLHRAAVRPTPPARGAAGPSVVAGALTQPTPMAGDAAVPPKPAPVRQAPIFSFSAGPMVYRLPSALPPMPRAVPLYRVQPVRLSAPAVTGIAALFPGLHGVAGPPAMRVFTDGRQRLAILPATGQVDYTAPSAAGSAHGVGVSPETAILAAHGWLALHGLYPSGVAERATVVRRVGALTSVRFLPALGLPLNGADTTISLIVGLDGTGRVISAHRLWPDLQPAGSAAILAPAGAVQHGHVPVAPGGARGAGGQVAGTSGTFTVRSVTLAYAPTTTAGGVRLLPVYVLSGSLRGPAGPARPFAQTVPATAPGG